MYLGFYNCTFILTVLSSFFRCSLSFLLLKVIFYQQVLVSRHVGIITFYNEVFVPAAKPFLVSLISSGTHPEDKKNASGICYTHFLSLNCLFFSYKSMMSLLLLRPNSWITQAISFPKFTRYVPEESFSIS
jgi:hypothetical protein